MADINFDCPACGHNLAVDEKGAGMTVPCPECSKPIQIPVPPKATPSALAVACPKCNQILKVSSSMVGQLIDCPKCGQPFEVPYSKQPAPKKPFTPPPLQQTGPYSLPEAISPARQQPPLHSRARAPNQPSVSQTTTCQFCGETILSSALKCKHCGEWLSDSARQQHARSNKTQGGFWLYAILALPISTAILLFFWISNITVNDGPMFIIFLLTTVNTFATAFFIRNEANEINKSNPQAGVRPFVWFILSIILWPVFYPAWFFRRRKYGLKNLLVPTLISSIIYSFIILMLTAVVQAAYESEKKSDAIQKAIDQLDQMAKNRDAEERGLNSGAYSYGEFIGRQWGEKDRMNDEYTHRYPDDEFKQSHGTSYSRGTKEYGAFWEGYRSGYNETR